MPRATKNKPKKSTPIDAAKKKTKSEKKNVPPQEAQPSDVLTEEAGAPAPVVSRRGRRGLRLPPSEPEQQCLIDGRRRKKGDDRQQGAKVTDTVVPDEVVSAGPSREPAKPRTTDKGDEAVSAGPSREPAKPRTTDKGATESHISGWYYRVMESLQEFEKSLASRPGETSLADQPQGLQTPLMVCQLIALKWLRWRETQRPCGGILADDMGLGRTITMLSLIVSDKDLNHVDDEDDEDDGPGTSAAAAPLKQGRVDKKMVYRGGTLVVCPASLMQQWVDEIDKNCTSDVLLVCLHHGANRTKHAHLLASYDLVVTSYNILLRESGKRGVLAQVQWRRIILDEAHQTRNHKSATSTAASALRGKRRWCLTATPILNKALDLFALLKFLRCTPFDDLSTWTQWMDSKSISCQKRRNTVMSCVLLRRTEQQVQQMGQLACLPERTAHLQEVTLSKEEMDIYHKVLVISRTLFSQFLNQRWDQSPDTHFSSRAKNTDKDKIWKMIALQGAKPINSDEILVLLLRLRQICCHCGLIATALDEKTSAEYGDLGGQDLLDELNKFTLENKRKNRRKDQEKEEEKKGFQLCEKGTVVAKSIRYVSSPRNPVFELGRQSSKIKAVIDCLKENVFSNKDDKAVVVSQWTSVLHLLEEELAKKKFKHITLNWIEAVPCRERFDHSTFSDKYFNQPSSEARVMLLTLCAAGEGLNLCGANHLLLLDPHWNPQLEEQAQGQIYRVGQTKPVHIYRFLCVNTVEQSIHNLQQAKLEKAAAGNTGDKNTSASKLTIEELKMLFNMEDSDSKKP